MRAYHLILALIVLAAHSPAFSADQAPSVSWLGDEPLTIHASGKLRDVLMFLSRLSHRYVCVDTALDWRSPEFKSLEAKPVTLSFDGATLDQIVLDICKQVGAVCSFPPATDVGTSEVFPVRLRPGDPLADPRPSVMLDGYLLRLTQVAVEAEHHDRFLWGTPSPDLSGDETVTLGLRITPRSHDAALRLLGTDYRATVLTDLGTTITGQCFFDIYLPCYPTYRDEVIGAAAKIVLPFHGPRPHVLRRIEGSLKLASTLHSTDFRIPANTTGQTFTRDGITVTVASWPKSDHGLLKVGLVISRPQAQGGAIWTDRQMATFVFNDGKHVPVIGGGYEQPRGSMTMEYECGYGTGQMYTILGGGAPPPLPEAEYMDLTYIVPGPVDKSIPFVIENIRLP